MSEETILAVRPSKFSKRFDVQFYGAYPRYTHKIFYYIDEKLSEALTGIHGERYELLYYSAVLRLPYKDLIIRFWK